MSEEQSAIDSENIAIRCSGVTKKFRIYDDMITGPMKEALFFWRKNIDRQQHFREVVAVENVTFTLKQGEVFGIIGPNGAGKTTLLKLLAGLLEIDGGEIEVNGRISALLIQGVAVHPDLAGRDNIRHSGLLLGMSEEEVAEKLPEIIEFAELGEYIDLPFRTYSAGMKARLLFSISISFTPEIMIIDEALAAGDSYFIRKCFQRIREICTSGRTIILVSHDISQVTALCDRAMLMVDGKVIIEGPVDEVAVAYDDWVFEKSVKNVTSDETSELRATPRSTRQVLFPEIRMLNDEGNETNGFITGEPMILEMDYVSKLSNDPYVDLFVGFLRVDGGEWVGYIDTNEADAILGKNQSPDKPTKYKLDTTGKITCKFDPLLLVNNDYALWIIISQGNVYHCEYRDVMKFHVSRPANRLVRGVVYFQPFELSLGPKSTKDEKE